MIWQTKRFSDAVNDVTGGNRKFSNLEYLTSGTLPIVDQGEAFIGGYTNDADKVSRARDVVVFGDHTKCFKYVDFDFGLGADGVKVLEPITEIDTKYLYYFLKTVSLPDVGYSRHFKFLKEITISYPPLPIQQKIAAILDEADALRRKDAALMAKYDELLQAVFYDMFGDPVKNEKGWEVKKLGGLAKISSGSTPSRAINEYYGGDILWVKTTEVNGNKIFDTEEKITEAGLQNSSCRIYPINSILVAMYGQGKTRGQVGILGAPAATNQACAVIPPSELYAPNYLFCLLGLLYETMRNQSRGGNQQNLNVQIVNGIDIIYPPLKQQQQFSLLFESILAQKSQLLQQQAHSENLFQSLMQRAFKGELV